MGLFSKSAPKAGKQIVDDAKATDDVFLLIEAIGADDKRSINLLLRRVGKTVGKVGLGPMLEGLRVTGLVVQSKAKPDVLEQRVRRHLADQQGEPRTPTTQAALDRLGDALFIHPKDDEGVEVSELVVALNADSKFSHDDLSGNLEYLMHIAGWLTRDVNITAEDLHRFYLKSSGDR